MKSRGIESAEAIVSAGLALILFSSLSVTTSWAEGPTPAASTADAAAGKGGSPAAASVTPSVTPLPLAPGAKVVTLWPAGHSTLKGFDQKEVFKVQRETAYQKA